MSKKCSTFLKEQFKASSPPNKNIQLLNAYAQKTEKKIRYTVEKTYLLPVSFDLRSFLIIIKF